MAKEPKALATDVVSDWTPRELVGWWQRRKRTVKGPVGMYVGAAGRALALGECLLAYDVAKLGLRFHPGNRALREKYGHALARSGATGAALAVARSLLKADRNNVEALGLRARALKDRWEAQRTPQALRLARSAYIRAHALRGGKGNYWMAINAATLSACAGRKREARRYANVAIKGAGAELDNLRAGRGAGLGGGDGNDVMWSLATLGEAHMVVGDLAGAQRYYRQAAEAAAGAMGHLKSMRRNPRLLLECAPGRPVHLLDQWLPIPCVVVFAGHMVDAPDRREPRFPASAEKEVAGAIARELGRINAGVGISSGARGADILFQEAMLARRDSELTLSLPYDDETFARDSVTPPGAGGAAGGGGRDWTSRFYRLRNHRDVRVTRASFSRISHPGGDNLYANRVIAGIGEVRARHYGARVVGLAVYDGKKGDGRGGTADAVKVWKKLGWEVCEIHPMNPGRVKVTPARKPIGPPPPPPPDRFLNPTGVPGVMVRTMAMLFADAVGYSKLKNADILKFIAHVLRPAARKILKGGTLPDAINTWGDALYANFPSAGAAAELAMMLNDFLRGVDWDAVDIAPPVRLRTALHFGPVFGMTDPITGQPTFTGNHVSRTARMEPVTPKGQVYVSEVFAAMLSIEGVPKGMAIEYVGNIGLAKNYGEYQTYVLKRRR